MLLTRGAIYKEIKYYDKALNDFNRVILLDSLNAEAFCRRGITYLFLNEFEKSIKDIERGIQLDPTLKPQVSDYLNEAKEKEKK